MKILCVTPWFPHHPQDQMGNFILDSVEALINVGHEVTVLVTEPWRPKIAGLVQENWRYKDFCAELFSAKFTLLRRRYLSLPRHFLTPISCWHYQKRIGLFLHSLVHQYHIDLIHAHTELAGTACVKVGQALNIPTVVTLHGMSTAAKLYQGRTRKMLFETPLKYADRVVLVGLPLVNFAKQFVKSSEHFRIIPNGFRFTQENSRAIKKTWAHKTLRFISVSNLEEGKGIDITLLALAKLKQAGITNWTYTIVGEGSEHQSLAALCQQLKIHQQVRFFGACTHDKVYQQLANADVFILPSYREAFGIAYLEAMSAGLLTIGVTAQGPQTFIEHGKTGFLVKPKNVESVYDLFTLLFAEKINLKSIADAGREYVHQHFTWRQHALKLTHLYAELM